MSKTPFARAIATAMLKTPMPSMESFGDLCNPLSGFLRHESDAQCLNVNVTRFDRFVRRVVDDGIECPADFL